MITFLWPVEDGHTGDNTSVSTSSWEASHRLRRAAAMLNVPLDMAHMRFHQLEEIYPDWTVMQNMDQIRYEMWDGFFHSMYLLRWN